MVLDRELETFRRELPELLKNHEGQFVLIQGEHVDSFWPTEDEAYVAGCQRFGIDPFLVKKIQETQPPLVVPYSVTPRCPS